MSKEAAKVVTKKHKFLDKTKLKKTIKNVLCRSDRDFWPALSVQESTELSKLISKHQVSVPEFKKLPWSVLKSIPKNERPKEKRFQAVPGFTFGLSQSARLIKSKETGCIIVDSGVTPRILVSHVIEAAVKQKMPVVCMADLKKVTTKCFGFPSVCIAISKIENCIDIVEKVENWKNLKSIENYNVKTENIQEAEDIEAEEVEDVTIKEVKPFEYLTRTSKNYRAFIPPDDSDISQEKAIAFTGQNYIKFGETATKSSTNRPIYRGMIVKKFSNNPNRKKKNKSKK